MSEFDKIHLQSTIKVMKIKISDIENIENKVQNLDFSEIYEEFSSDVPVKASLKVEILGEIIKITGKINALLNLTCDVCLKDFTKEFNIDVEEFFTKYKLSEEYENEFEIKNDGFVEDLNGADEIDITDFVYQTVILNIPNKLVCGINCNGGENLNKYVSSEIIDPRLKIFKDIKIERKG